MAKMAQDRIYNYFERNPQLHVLFIFDRMNIIQNELDEMKEWKDEYISLIPQHYCKLNFLST